MARASWAAERAHERVRGMSESPVGDSRIGWGGCGQLVPGCRSIVSFTQSLPHSYELGPGGCGPISVRMSQQCLAHILVDTSYRHAVGEWSDYEASAASFESSLA